MSLSHQSKESLIEYVLQLQFASIEAICEITIALTDLGAAEISNRPEVVESLLGAIKILSEQWVDE